MLNLKMEEFIVMKKILSTVLISALVLSLAACSSMSKTGKGAAIGGTIGGVVGGIITDDTAKGAIMGAAIGGAAGAVIGSYMDDQAEEIERDLEGATVERVGEGIKITFDSGLLFDVDKTALKPASKTNLENLAVILQKYEDTEVLLEGHTDSTGSLEYNMALSEKRAEAVAQYLVAQGVDRGVISTTGLGPDFPVADNSNSEGRQLNRRVDVILPNLTQE